MLDSTVSPTNTSDKVVSEQRVESVDAKLFEELRNAINPYQIDVGRAEQKLIYSSHIPALEIVSTESAALNVTGRAIEEEMKSFQEKIAFNTMITTDGQTVFNSPSWIPIDYFEIVDGLDDPGNLLNGTDGAITKEGLARFIEIEAAASGTPQFGYRDHDKDVFTGSAKQLLENWDSPELSNYKDASGAMSKESYALGIESLHASRVQLVTTKYDLQRRAKEWLNEVNSQVAP